jgi:hypothetical protein
MLLKSSQQKVVLTLETFFQKWKDESFSYNDKLQKLKMAGLDSMIASLIPPVKEIYTKTPEYRDFSDIPESA